MTKPTMDKPKPMLNPVVVQQTHPEVTTRDITDQTSYLNRSDLSGKTRGAQVFYKGETYTAQGSEPTSPWTSGAKTITPAALAWVPDLSSVSFIRTVETVILPNNFETFVIKTPSLDSMKSNQIAYLLDSRLGEPSLARGWVYLQRVKNKIHIVHTPDVNLRVEPAITDKELKPETIYTIRVIAVNRVGVGCIGQRYSGHESPPKGTLFYSYSFDGVDNDFSLTSANRPTLPKKVTFGNRTFDVTIKSLPVWAIKE